MFDGVTEFTSAQPGDSAEFIRKVQALVVGGARDNMPARLYVIRIDNWFGPKWMHFAGKFTAGKGFAIGVHKKILHVPPFVPHRVIAEQVFAGPNYEERITRPPLHIECTSKVALTRRIADVDTGAIDTPKARSRMDSNDPAMGFSYCFCTCVPWFRLEF